MDTKTPPIPLKQQEKRHIKREKSSGGGEDLSLPPLAAGGSRQKSSDKKNLGQQWTNGTPYVARNQEHQSKRPYRVLHIGATPLMHACQQGDRSRVLRLLKEQEDTINYRDRTLRNALHYCMDASTGGAVASAAPELVNAPDAEGHTPLHLAVIAGDTQLVAVLLANGADVNAKDLEGHSVLHWATVCGEAECVRLVLAAGARPSTPDLRGGSPLHYAAQCCGAAATAELSVPKKVGLKVLHTLLEFGADVNAKDEDGRQPILWAASAGSVEAVLALARAGGTAAAGATDKDGLTALHCAASRGHARCVEALVNLCGSQPDHVDDNGCSALHYAATLGHADATALLLRLGADPNRQDRKGRTPALCAAAKGQLETLKILAQHGGSLHARTVRGTGVAHEAVLSGRIELIEWLARKKPSTLDVATHDGRTPLHVAALHGYLDTCKVLLDHGARINSVFRTSKSGPMTPLDAALYRGHRDCAKLIQMHGGTTAQHVRSHRTAPNRVFAAKVKIKHSNSTSQSDTDSPRRRQKSNVYIEEHWIEKRTRRHSNSRQPSSRRGSRSFSEEEIRLSKTLRDRRRRAKSESSRYEGTETEEKHQKIRRRRSKHEYSESSSDYDSPSPSSPEKGRPESPENRSLSDDSLEVVVVRRSVEKKSEKIQFSDKKSKKPTETSRETRVTETERRSSRKKPKKAEQIRKRSQDAGKSKQSVGKTKNVVDKSKSSGAKSKKDATDSTSQEAVERVTVTALVHKDQPPDTPEVTLESRSRGQEGHADDGLKKKSKIDEILEKADEMQTALMTKAEDLRRGVEDVRRQVSEEVPLGGGDEEEGELGEGVSMVGDSKVDKKRSSGSEVSRSGRQSEQSEQGRSRGDAESGDEDEEEEESGRSQLSSSGRSESGSPGKKSGADGERSAPSRQSEKSHKSGRSEKSGKSAKSEKSERTDRSESRKSKSSEKSEKSRSSEKSESPNKSEKSKSSEQSESPERSGKSLKPEHLQSPDKTEKSETQNSEKSETQKSENSDQAESPQKSEDSKKPSKSESSERSRSSENSESSEKSAVEADSPEKPSKTTESEVQKTVQSQKSSPEPSKSEQKSDKVQKPSEDQKTDQMTPTEDKADQKSEDIRHIDSSSASSKEPKKVQRPSTGKRSEGTASKSPDKGILFESSEERSPDRSAIVAVIESPEWDEEDEEVAKEIQKVVAEATEDESEPDDEDDDDLGVLRVLPSTSEEETPRRPVRVLRGAKLDNVPRVERRTIGSPRRLGVLTKQRKDSGGRDSGIEPSPRVSKIPKRTMKCCPNTEKQQALNMETIQRDVQISLRRYHLERKIFFQLMELKRLQIRHGRVNEHILVKRQVETFNKAGMSGPILGVVKYDQALTFREFETFLYDQLRRLQRRPATPEWCTEAKQCTQKTHRCHHATSAYTSVPIYTYLDGEGHREREATLLPRIESRGKGQMTVEVTKGEEKQVISLPAEQLDRTKKYFITFTVRGEAQGSAEEALTNRRNAQRNTKSV